MVIKGDIGKPFWVFEKIPYITNASLNLCLETRVSVYKYDLGSEDHVNLFQELVLTLTP